MKQVMKNGKLTTAEMLEELPIGIDQLRVYLNDGRLPSKKVRGRYEVERNEFEKFKFKFGF